MEPGELIAERYRIVSLVGRGAMGVVWRARDERIDRLVAVKQLLVDESGDGAKAEEATARALREGRIAGRLRHPNAIAVYDVVEHAGRPCLVMEYLEAQSLAGAGVLRPRQVAAIGAQLASALAAAHEAGIVHRDVKPDNVLVTRKGVAKITDFGISRAAGDNSVTATGVLAGTPAYLAPEVARGAEADFRSDVFSLGATLYALLEGEPPFGVDVNPIKLLHKVAAGRPNPPRHAGELTAVLMWLLRRDPGERPTMVAAQEVLASVAAGRRTLPPTPRDPTLALPPPRRRVSRRALVAGAAAAVLLAGGVGVGLLIDDAGAQDAAGPAPTSPYRVPPPPSPCTAAFEVRNSWPDGYEAQVVLRNDGEEPITGWRLTWTMPDGHRIENLWGGAYVPGGDAVTVTNADHNVTVAPAGTVEVGMTVTAGGDGPGIPEVTCEER